MQLMQDDQRLWHWRQVINYHDHLHRDEYIVGDWSPDGWRHQVDCIQDVWAALDDDVAIRYESLVICPDAPALRGVVRDEERGPRERFALHQRNRERRGLA